MESPRTFSDSEIREHLSSIISSSVFRGSSILCNFLEFIIAETISGRSRDLKEYTIGVNVLSRNSDFNPQLDAIVRIHAGRLRRALKEYYFDLGKNDLIYIEIPKGSYIPVFRLPDKNQIKENSNIPLNGRIKALVAVFPFRNITSDPSRDFFADGIGELLSNDLTLFNELSVISYYSSRYISNKTPDLKEAALLLGANYILTGCILNDAKHIRISVQLISADNSEQLWSKAYERNNTASGLFEIQKEIVKNVLTAIGGYFGIIIKDVIKAPYHKHSNGIEVYDAIFWYYHYQKVFTTEAFAKAVSAIETAVKLDPDYALGWAVLGELYLDDKALEFTHSENQVETGLKYAIHAAQIDPGCQHAYQTQAWAYILLHEKEKCLNALEKCLSINPNSSSAVGNMGFGLICAGEFKHGIELLRESMEHNTFSPWYFYMARCLFNLHDENYQKALHWAEKIDMPEIFWDPLLKAVLHANLDHKVEASKNLSLLQTLVPDIEKQAKQIVPGFLLSNELTDKILNGLKKAGLKVK